MPSIIFVQNDLVMGGVYTLIYRLTEQLTKENRVYICCNSIQDGLFQSLKECGANLCKIKELYASLNNSDSISIIAFEIDTYLQCIKNRKNSSINIYLYVVHPRLFLDFEGNLPVYKSVIHNSMKKFVQEQIESKSIFFMDYQCLESAYKNYGYEINKYSTENIVRLISENVVLDQLDTNKLLEKRYNILSVSRADFPFKGYLIGLLNSFKELKKSFPLLTLTIIASGQHIDELKNSIKTLGLDVFLIEGLPFEQLDSFYKKAGIYVGMGTTIIESAARFAVSIPVQSYTYECKTNGLFYENPEWVTADYGAPKDVYNVIKKVLLEDPQLYIDKCILSKNSVDKYYSSGAVLAQIYSIVSDTTVHKYNKFPKLAYFLKQVRNKLK